MTETEQPIIRYSLGSLAQAIVQAREGRGISRAELSRRTGLSPARLRLAELGTLDVTSPDAHTIADALGLDWEHELEDARLVVACPYCDTSLTYAAVKSLRGRASRLRQITRDVLVQMPCCDTPVDYDEVKTLWAKATSAKRTRHGAGSGRPRGSYKTGAARCPCGAMTLKRAKARAHKCQPPPG